MEQYSKEEQNSNEESTEIFPTGSGILDRFEVEFDWNLIGIVSIWLFLFATAFLIF